MPRASRASTSWVRKYHSKVNEWGGNGLRFAIGFILLFTDSLTGKAMKSVKFPSLLLATLAAAFILAVHPLTVALSAPGPITGLGFYDKSAFPRRVQLQWNAATNADKYRVYIRWTPSNGVWDGDWDGFDSQSSTSLTVQHQANDAKNKQIVRGRETHWKVVAFENNTEGTARYVSGIVGKLGSSSNPRSASKLRNPKKDTSGAYPGIALHWDHPARGAVFGYRVQRRLSGSTGTWTAMPSQTGAVTTNTHYHILFGGTPDGQGQTVLNPNCFNPGEVWDYRIRPVGHGGTLGPATTFKNLTADNTTGPYCGDATG